MNEKRRYLIIVCLLFSSSFFISVEASEGGPSSVGIEFYQNPTAPVPKDAPPKTDEPAANPKEPAGPLQGDQRGGGSTQIVTAGSQLPRTESKSQANLNILGLVLIGLVGIVQREKGRHEAN